MLRMTGFDRGPLVSEATALPIVWQPLPILYTFIRDNNTKDFTLSPRVT